MNGNDGDLGTLNFNFLEYLSKAGLIDEGAVKSLAKESISQFIKNFTANNPNATVNLTKILEDAGIRIPPNFPVNLNNITIGNIYSQFILDQLIDQIDFNTLFAPQLSIRILGGVSSPKGKWPTSLGNVVVLEKKYIPETIRQMLPKNTQFVNDILDVLINSTSNTNNTDQTDMINALKLFRNMDTLVADVNMDEYAILLVIHLRDRWDIYQMSEINIKKQLIYISNKIYNRLGLGYPGTPTTPIYGALGSILYVKMFLQQIFGGTMAITVTLGSMLIYSLLLSNVQEKTYEYGMLRALGFQRNSLISLLVIQALFFTIPGISLGLLCAWLANVPVTIILNGKTNSTLGYSLSPSAILLSTFIGLVLPIVSNIAPIKNALSRTLRDSLDVYHTTPGTSVKMIKLENLGLSPWQIVLSLLTIIAGFMVYYVVPYSFTFNNLPLFLSILTIILLGMVMGLCMISTTLQPYFERVVLQLIVWGKDRALLNLIRKSLSGHRIRNRKTALMFTVSLGFIVFAGTSFRLQANSIQDALKANLGTDIYIAATAGFDKRLDEPGLRDLLNMELAKGKKSLVKSFNFATFPLDSHPKIQRTYLSNLAGQPDVSIQLYGLEESHLQTVWTQYYMISEATSQFSYSKVPGTSQADIVKSLYTDAGKEILPIEKNGIWVPPVVGVSPFASTTPSLDNRTLSQVYHDYYDLALSQSLNGGATLELTTPMSLSVAFESFNRRVDSIDYYSKNRAFLKKLPGFFMSSYDQFAEGSPIFISMDQYTNLMKNIDHIQDVIKENQKSFIDYTQFETPPKQFLYIRMLDDSTSKQTEYVIDSIRNYIKDDSIIIVDVKAIVNTTQTAVNSLILFFNIVALVNSVLCFFLLWLSFDTNVRENSWEFGVLRAIGLNAKQVLRVYIYEALSIVLSALVLGTITGIVTSVTLQLQFNLFTELPFSYDFPYFLYFSVVIVSILVAVIGAYIPTNELQKGEIAIVLRGG
eukprot:TRINITY_DN4729_c1_g3_i1.p1 TRINITY_DN4729_c1_g3~~TRINITY_DN4729_c1_g3_i1.p1  ORF type:complete len:1147 (+),score=296.15 TRINITY_DN4729_c1_g3_i1:490-3441(+)